MAALSRRATRMDQVLMRRYTLHDAEMPLHYSHSEPDFNAAGYVRPIPLPLRRYSAWYHWTDQFFRTIIYLVLVCTRHRWPSIIMCFTYCLISNVPLNNIRILPTLRQKLDPLHGLVCQIEAEEAVVNSTHQSNPTTFNKQTATVMFFHTRPASRIRKHNKDICM